MQSLNVKFCCTNFWTPIKVVLFLSPGLLQGSMMSSMIYTQGHIGEEMYKLLESLTSLPNQGGQNLTGINVNDKDQIVFALFLFPIHFTVFITAERRSCDTTPSQLALNGDSMVQLNLIDYWTALVMQTPKHDTRDMQLKRFAFRTQEESNKQCFCLRRCLF